MRVLFKILLDAACQSYWIVVGGDVQQDSIALSY